MKYIRLAFLLFFILKNNHIKAQFKFPKDSSIRILKYERFCNEKPCMMYSISDSISQKIIFSEQNNFICDYTYYIKGVDDFTDILFHNNGSVQFIIDVKDSKVNGQVIAFDRRGKVNIIFSFKNSVLTNVLYYRKYKFLKDYYKQYGYGPPATYKNTQNEYPTQ